jgi:hypothetical protein
MSRAVISSLVCCLLLASQETSAVWAQGMAFGDPEEVWSLPAPTPPPRLCIAKIADGERLVYRLLVPYSKESGNGKKKRRNKGADETKYIQEEHSCSLSDVEISTVSTQLNAERFGDPTLSLEDLTRYFPTEGDKEKFIPVLLISSEQLPEHYLLFYDREMPIIWIRNERLQAGSTKSKSSTAGGG